MAERLMGVNVVRVGRVSRTEEERVKVRKFEER